MEGLPFALLEDGKHTVHSFVCRRVNTGKPAGNLLNQRPDIS